MRSKSDVAVRFALGLTAKLFPSTPSFADVRLLTHGRVHLWPEWEAQPDAIKELVAAFITHRPDELAEDVPLLERMRAAVADRDDFEAVEPDGPWPNWSTRYRVVPGDSLDSRISQWLSKLEKLHGRGSGRPEVKREGADAVVLVGDETSYRIPTTHLPSVASNPLRLHTSGGPGALELDVPALRALARRIDGIDGPQPGLYESVAVEQFAAKLTAGDDSPVRVFPGGVTQLAVAPTGSGKSVFARLQAIHLAEQGVPVALVVPDVQSVWKEVVRLEAAGAAAGLSLQIVPLSSWRNTAEKLAAHLEHPIAEDPDGRWALRTVGYSCHLRAYVEGSEPPMPGGEPCTRLRQPAPSGNRDRQVGCPLRHECGRFSTFERAVSADIVVVNHHAFLAGRVPLEVSVDGGPPRKISTAELVLRRCAVVFIDEIDALQDTAIGADSRGVLLSSRGRLSKPNQLYQEVERRRAENRIAPGVRFERGRSALLRIMHEAERLSELINRKELDWPERGRMTWREAHDAWLAGRLYGDDPENGLARLRSLFDKQPIIDDPRSERLRVALAPLGPGLGDGTPMADIRAEIMQELSAWPLTASRPGGAQQLRDGIANRIIVRAVLVQLDQALGHLRPQLPGLEQQDVHQAADLREDLLGYAPWQPSPTGALGRRLFGYSFSERLGEQGALETRVMSGDPHGLLREIGGLVARALAGRPRVVVGLSATCRFRGSPRADVLGQLGGWVQDTARNVRVIGAPVEARISGVGSSAERMEAARTAAEQLWPSTLRRYLDDLTKNEQTRERARALLVTGSYSEAKAVAEGLRRVIDSAVSIRYLVPNGESAASDRDALQRSMLESFGETAAPAVLVGPLSVVARGHNILQRGTSLSALAGIFVLTRPVPPSHDADRFLAHMAYNARLFPPTWEGEPGATVEAERRAAWKRLRDLQRSPATFRHMDSELRRELVCDVLSDLAQLAGRARRGGTAVDLVFVDGAFQDEVVPWTRLVREVLDWWREKGWLCEMVDLHGAFVAGLAAYVGFDLDGIAAQER